MTDADVDGAHIATLLMTYFYHLMPALIRAGHLYLALPPLFKVVSGKEHFYLSDQLALDKLLSKLKGKKYQINRFKGLGEMSPGQLKETTMQGDKRILQKIAIAPEGELQTSQLVKDLMGRKAEMRFRFISQQASHLENSALDLV